MLNIAGPEFDFANVVFVVLGECEHRRRGLDQDRLEEELLEIAREKLLQIKRAYDEFGGSAAYWKAIETEVLETAMPQYIDSAQEIDRLERSGYDVYRRGDLPARGLFALGGLFVGVILLALPFIPKVFEAALAFLMAGGGFAYPDLKRYTHERRHFRLLNRLVEDAARYQQSSRLHYMTTHEIRESFTIAPSETSEERRESQTE